MIGLISMIHFYYSFDLKDAMVAVVWAMHIITGWPFKAEARIEAAFVVLPSTNEHIAKKFTEGDGQA